MKNKSTEQLQSILITGASSGIGYETALYLDELGFRVFAGVRNEAAFQLLQEKSSSRLVPVILDIEKDEQIKKAVQQIELAVGEQGIDGLINNAGIVVAGPLEYLPIQQLRKQIEINVIGQVAVTQAFLPLIRQAQGRIIHIGSVAGRSTFPLIGPYNASKYALEAITDAMRMELKPWNIHVSVIEPGVIKTPIWRKSIKAYDDMFEQFPEEAVHHYGRLMSIVRKYAQGNDTRGSEPQKVIRAIEHALTARKPKTRYVVGWDAKVRMWMNGLPDRWKDWLILKALSKLKP